MAQPFDLRPVFEAEALRSERHRVIGVLVMIVMLGLLSTTRSLIGGNDEQLKSLPLILGLVFFAAAYEAWMLFRIGRAIRAGSVINVKFWFANTLIENTLPTLTLLLLTETDFIGPYRALNAPAILIYPLFIILSVLQLRPRFSILAGAIGAIGYTTVLLMTYARHEASEYGEAVLPKQLYATYPIILLGLGSVTAFVSTRARKYVEAGLEEGARRQRIEGDLELARSIQQGLLPQDAPSIKGFDVSGWNEPADQTGGDYYDWVKTPDGTVAVTVADVTGHGIGPALVTAVCRAYARACFQNCDAMPTVIRRMNDLLHADLDSGRFVTFALAVIDPENSIIRLLSAGHGPVLLYRADSGLIEDLRPDGMPLGVMEGMELDEARTLSMRPGDVLVIVTDGFFEWARSDGVQFGIERMTHYIKEHAGDAPDELIGGLHRAVLDFVGNAPQQDDLTAVVIRKTA